VPICKASIGNLLSRTLLVVFQRVLARRLLDETGLSMAQKILIVEDNSDLSQLLAFYLNDAGYETSRAGNLTQGISKALAERPDLIITDLYLPDMNAVDATVILKQDPATSGIPIVVLTAMAVGDWKTKALKAGVAKYLIKPVSPPELTEVVRTLIQQPSSLTER
jgi:two-component system, cell cycle response regulator DivK